MARLILSAGMFSALAAATAPRNRGLASGSPPPWRAAMVISRIRRVNILPRLASRAPFLCLIVAHLEWPDMVTSKAGFAADSRRRLAAKGEYSTQAGGLVRAACVQFKAVGGAGERRRPRRAAGAQAEFPRTESQCQARSAPG